MRPLAALHLALVATALAGCAAPPHPTGTVTATIDGDALSTTALYGSLTSDRIEVGGLFGDGRRVELDVAGSAPGTYPLGPASASTAAWSPVPGVTFTTGRPGGEGEVVVHAAAGADAFGTFRFRAPDAAGRADTVEVSGSFDVRQDG